MVFAVLPTNDGWQWHLLDDVGVSLCSSCRAFATALHAFEDLMLSKDGLTDAPIIDAAGSIAEIRCSRIYYVQ